MKRVGAILGLRPEAYEEYTRYHRKIWPEIEAAIRESGITNYSIYHFQGTMFAYYEYTGPEEEYEERMRKLDAAPRMQEWYGLMQPMQAPITGRKPGEWWAAMEEVFHQD
jgi:L-rhamnose mutarotase